ncbi:MAG: DUF6599 family protein [Candidatus Latescibacterota bacterium]
MKRYVFSIAFAALFLSMSLGWSEEALFLKNPPESFTLKEPVSFYNRDNLYEYIDGQAVFYNSYGFTRLEHGVYLKEGGTYTVDVYELGSKLSALGAYRQQREEDAAGLGLGVEGAIINYLTVFYKDKYYVEIIPLTSGNDDLEAMKLLAAYVEGMISGSNDLPPELAFFPSEGLIPKSERYVDESLISYSFMGRGLTALYREDGKDKEFKVFVALTPDKGAAAEIYKGFIAKMNQTDSIQIGDREGMKGELPYRGASMACVSGQFVYGCMSFGDGNKAASILTAIGEKLKQYPSQK